ncbi:hypothetical protein SAMN02745704_01096 [Paucidesulfovibrio gracilis DSM 16080]|uniref:Uncharacterized protein n=1 Tax=Paucidesulfovibrio gracilis DSM 16080 TaxID=1121449 RepID=A0A1T4WLZ2_9BACT|nr:hypothetical protein [Paucidesulfovibrio gracilis]SKA78167.1 hypothetical protein SAMN02745704_01096 [Paucidesulfovibrio gracilis DSM 16080]
MIKLFESTSENHEVNTYEELIAAFDATTASIEEDYESFPKRAKTITGIDSNRADDHLKAPGNAGVYAREFIAAYLRGVAKKIIVRDCIQYTLDNVFDGISKPIEFETHVEAARVLVALSFINDYGSMLYEAAFLGFIEHAPRDVMENVSKGFIRFSEACKAQASQDEIEYPLDDALMEMGMDPASLVEMLLKIQVETELKAAV